MNIIPKLLKTTEEDYQNMILEHFIYWCLVHGNSQQELQKLVLNKELLKWYKRQIERLELVFYDKTGNLKIKETRALYFNVLSEIGDYYPPKHLLKKFKKTKTIVNPKLYNLN